MHKIYLFLSSLLVFLIKVIMFRKISLDIWSIKVFDSDMLISKPIGEKIFDSPTIEARDVTDLNAEFVADPFILMDKGNYYMFFEAFDKSSRKGVIGLATSNDGNVWSYDKIILKEEFHLSYPYVFQTNDHFYMIPETNEARGVFLYRAKDFPYEWEKVTKIIDGEYLDPSIFHYKNKWWLFAAQTGKLHLFYSNELMGKWKEHPESPLIKENFNITRPGGRVIINAGSVYRYTQDCEPSYGSSVKIFKITNISELEYEEEELNLVLSGSKKQSAWNRDGMHSIDQLKKDDNKWLIVVDGHRREKRNYLLWKIEQTIAKVSKFGIMGVVTLLPQMDIEQPNLDFTYLQIITNFMIQSSPI